MKFAILAAGGIARKMAEAVTGIEKAGTEIGRAHV